MIGIDIGGANLKVADSEGVHIHYCPLWEQAPLNEILHRYAGEEAAVVMSGEQADSFRSKDEGIRFIVNSVRSVFPRALFYGIDGRFHTGAVPQLSAANWLAASDCLRERYPEGVLVDMGSTTTDIIPLPAFDALKGMTDLERLQKGYLVYTGMLRTPVPAVLQSVRLEGRRTLLSSERFAVAADAHLVLGHINNEEYAVPTPDGARIGVDASLQRLSRLVCADLDEIGRPGAMEIAHQFWDQQMRLIGDELEQVMDTAGASSLICAGIGSHLISTAFGGIDLHGEIGEWCEALPAYAVREVARRTAGS